MFIDLKETILEVIYPGSFDPLTNGHLDIIERAADKFERVIVSVLNNQKKTYLFSLQERIDMLKKSVSHLKNVEIDNFDGLLIDYVNEKKCCMIIRGLRAVSDFEYEMLMAIANKKLNPCVETLFLVSASEYSFLSSSLVKEISGFGGDVSSMVPKYVEKALNKKFREEKNGK